MSNPKYLDFARHLAQQTGKILLQHFGQSPQATEKQHNDVVTQADLEAEKYIVEQIRANFPGHKIYSEESIRDDFSENDLVWVIDPLDGTNNFYFQMPYFCTSIALVQGGKSQIGVVYSPPLDYMFTAGLDQGAYLNGEKISASPDPRGSIFLIAETGYRDTDKARNMFELVQDILPDISRFRSLGALALDIALIGLVKGGCCLASGFYPWDTAASSLIATEAGATATDLEGHELDFHSRTCLIAHPEVHAQISRILKTSSHTNSLIIPRS